MNYESLQPTSQNERAICVAYRFSREGTLRMPRHVTTVRLDDGIDEDALAVVIRVLISRHDVLRTSYFDYDGNFMALVHDPPEDPRWQQMLRQQLAGVDGDLLFAPDDLWTVSIIDDPAGRLLRVEAHHIISDAWSMELLRRELVYLLKKSVSGSMRDGYDEPRGPHARPYREYAEYELGAGRRRAREERLKQQLEDLESFPSTVHFPCLEVPSTGQSLPFALTAAESNSLRAVARNARTTPFTVLTSVFLSVLSRRTGEQRVMVGTSVINRPLGWSKTLGFFANRTFASLSFTKPLSFSGVIDAGKRGSARMWAGANVPCPLLVEELGRRSVMHRTSRWRCNVVFEFYLHERFGDRYLRLADGDAECGPGLGQEGREDLLLVMGPTSDGRFAGSLRCTGRVPSDYAGTVIPELRMLLSLGSQEPFTPFDEMSALAPFRYGNTCTESEERTDALQLPAPSATSDFWAKRPRPPFDAPSNRSECLISELILDVTGRGGVGRHDDLHLHAALTHSEIAAICSRGRAQGIPMNEAEFLSYSHASGPPVTIASLASLWVMDLLRALRT